MVFTYNKITCTVLSVGSINYILVTIYFIKQSATVSKSGKTKLMISNNNNNNSNSGLVKYNRHLYLYTLLVASQ